MNWKNAGEGAFFGWFRMLLTDLVLSVVGLRYCLSWRFLRYELHRRLFYFFCSPWAISRRFLDQQEEYDAQGYGETPLVTLAAIARRLELTEADTLLELGSGTGRNCAWLSANYGCRATGVEQIPQYVRFAQYLEHRYFSDNNALPELDTTGSDTKVNSLIGDMFTMDMSGWNYVYVDCTAMSESCIRKVAFLCAGLPNDSILVTVNASMHALMPERFQIERAFTGLFLWGWSDIRFHRVGPPVE